MNEIILKEYMNLTYSNQCKSATKRSMNFPSYSKIELQNWLINQPNYGTLFKVWLDSGKDRWLKPSIDRKDDYISYTLDNIQLMTWKENHQKSMDDKVNGVTNKNNEAIIMYDIRGKFINKFYSIHQAGRELPELDYRNIHKSCNEQIFALANRYIFVYESKDTKEYITYRLEKYSNSNNKSIVEPFHQICKTTGSILNTFTSTKEAKLHLGIKHAGNISSCLKNRTKSAFGFLWEFCKPEVIPNAADSAIGYDLYNNIEINNNASLDEINDTLNKLKE